MSEILIQHAETELKEGVRSWRKIREIPGIWARMLERRALSAGVALIGICFVLTGSGLALGEFWDGRYGLAFLALGMVAILAGAAFSRPWSSAKALPEPMVPASARVSAAKSADSIAPFFELARMGLLIGEELYARRLIAERKARERAASRVPAHPEETPC